MIQVKKVERTAERETRYLIYSDDTDIPMWDCAVIAQDGKPPQIEIYAGSGPRNPEFCLGYAQALIEAVRIHQLLSEATQ